MQLLCAGKISPPSLPSLKNNNQILCWHHMDEFSLFLSWVSAFQQGISQRCFIGMEGGMWRVGGAEVWGQSSPHSRTFPMVAASTGTRQEESLEPDPGGRTQGMGLSRCAAHMSWQSHIPTCPPALNPARNQGDQPTLSSPSFPSLSQLQTFPPYQA